MSKLTPKQEMFCREYLVDFNGAQAAIRAGYSVKTAKQAATENLTKPDVQLFLGELISARECRVDRTGDEVLRRVWEVADLKVVVDTGKIINGEFCLADSDEWTEATQRVVRSVKTSKTIRRIGKEEIETIDSSVKAPEVMSALAKLMEHHGLTNDFNQAIACLRKYGLVVKQDAMGKWLLEDLNA